MTGDKRRYAAADEWATPRRRSDRLDPLPPRVRQVPVRTDLSGEQLTDLLRAGEITGDDHARA